MEKRASMRLAEYIKSQLDKGASREHIAQILLDKGYPDEEIEKTFRMTLELSLKKERPKWKRRAAIISVILIAFAAAVYSLSAQTATRFREQEHALVYEVSEGDESALSRIPAIDDTNFVILERKAIPLRCVSEGKISCVNPVMDSFYIKSNGTNVSRFQQIVYMQLKNKENEDASVNFSESFVSSTGLCGFLNDSLGLTAKGAAGSGFICVNPADPDRMDAETILQYSAGGRSRTSRIAFQNLNFTTK